ncbi:uncharacterized protein LOC135396921 [Ornithodoros turicata]|uniref:uncharacterized protein LOC135375246 n=1 Tax=Ornithodoros turicata TaxID=34597 RepID=UPI003138D115
MRNASPLRLIYFIHLLEQVWLAYGGGISSYCTKDADCDNLEFVFCKDGVCSCQAGYVSRNAQECTKSKVSELAEEERECFTDHQCYRGYCWDGECHCKDGFSKEKSPYGGWNCVHRTSSFGFGILAVIPVTVVVICLLACCVQLALRKQQHSGSNAENLQELATGNSDAGAAASGVSNIYRQRTYFPHYVEAAKAHTSQSTPSPCVTRSAVATKSHEGKEKSSNHNETTASNNPHV